MTISFLMVFLFIIKKKSNSVTYDTINFKKEVVFGNLVDIMKINLKQKNSKVLIWILLLVYIAVLVKLIILKHYPLSLVIDELKNIELLEIKRRFQWSNFIPFKTINNYLFLYNVNTNVVVQNLVGNIIAFIPLGFLLPILIKRLRNLKYIFFIALFTSLFFETIQILSGIGSFDIDDLILNTLGALLGYSIYRVIVIA